MTPYFCYREAQNQNELEALLRLRYNVYRTSRLKGFCPENPWGLNMDWYDCRSRHFGLFHCENGGQRPIGYMRVIEDKETPTASWVRRIARMHSIDLLIKVCAEPKWPFPLMSYVPGAEVVVNQMMREDNGGKICEASRFIIDPDFASIRLGKHVIESAIAIYFLCYGFQKAMVACSEIHGRLYQTYGFKFSEETTPFILEKSGDKTYSQLLLLQSNQNISSELRQRIASIANTYREHDCICFYRDRPGEYGPPIKTDFFPKKITLKKSFEQVRIAATVV